MTETKKAKNLLQNHFRHVSSRHNLLTIRREYFYSHRLTTEKIKNRVSEILNGENISHNIVEAYDQWKPFKGGAPVSKQSHFCIKVEIND